MAAARAGKAWTPLQSLSPAQKSAGAQLNHSAGHAQLPEEPATGASSGQAEAEQERLRAAARQRAEVSRRREEQWAENARWWRAAWREVETARARVHQ